MLLFLCFTAAVVAARPADKSQILNVLTYYGKILPTDDNGRPIYPRVTERGQEYPVEYLRHKENSDLFPTDPSGLSIYDDFDEEGETSSKVLPTDTNGNFIVKNGRSTDYNGKILPTDESGRIYWPAEYLPTDIITCGCGNHYYSTDSYARYLDENGQRIPTNEWGQFIDKDGNLLPTDDDGKITDE